MNDIKQPSDSFDWLKWAKWLLAFKLVSALIVTFGEFSHPHFIRQLDTMGVALRYWMRWTLEPNAYHRLLPATLAAADGTGIVPTEFPLMNLFYAPVFALPIEAARAVAWFSHVVMCVLLSWWHFKLWSKKTLGGADAGTAALLLPVVGISSVFLGRFMPDYLAFILVSCSIALSWEKPKPFFSFMLATTGLLMKPPLIIAYAICFLDFRRQLRALRWIIPAVAITFFYYKFVNGYIKTLTDFPVYFLTELRNPVSSVVDFFSEPSSIVRLLVKNFFGVPYLVFGLILLGINLATLKKRVDPSRYFLILALQVLGIALLDGEHSFAHFYYYIGTSFIVSLLFVHLMNNATWKAARITCLLLISAFLVESFLYEIRPLVRDLRGVGFYAQCSQLRASMPDFPWRRAYRFRTKQILYPDLGLCFGEITGSTRSEFGIYRKSDDKPLGCAEVASTKDIELVHCK